MSVILEIVMREHGLTPEEGLAGHSEFALAAVAALIARHDCAKNWRVTHHGGRGPAQRAPINWAMRNGI